MAAAPWLMTPGTVRPQERPARQARIGILGATTAAGYGSRWEAFRAGMRALGYAEGQNIVFESRWADDRYERLPDLASELVRSNVDVLVTHGIPGTRAAKLATQSIPIVMAIVADPVAAGLVVSYARPGTNVTGSAFLAQELAAKRIGLLRELSPRITQVAVLNNPKNPAFGQAMLESMETAGKAVGVKLHPFDVVEPRDYDAAFAAIAERRLDAVAITEEATINANARLIAGLAERHRLASIGNKEFAEAGGLVGYGANLHEMFRHAATLVDKLLKGAKASDLPVEQPTRFELVVNLKTARAIGASIAQPFLLRADITLQP